MNKQITRILDMRQIAFIGLFVYLFIGLLPQAYADSYFLKAGGRSSVSSPFTASVSAQVGGIAPGGGTTPLTLSVAGYIAPYASVSLVIDGLVYRSTAADAQGNFYISQVLISAGLTKFCLDSVDFKRLGESEACFTIPPATTAISKTNIFLPPTLGVFRTEINAGDKALAFGYGMPGAAITVHLDGGIGCVVTADTSGYYECNIVISKVGSHELYADAVLKGKPSEPQLKRVLIKGLSLAEQVGKTTTTGIGNLWNLLTSLPGGVFVLLVGLLIILIIILIWKLKGGGLPHVALPHPGTLYHHAFDSLFRERRLHHYWMQGVGY